MFEDQEPTVQKLLATHPEFKALFEQHQELKNRVNDANSGTSPVDDVTLDRMKKEKLMLKDKMAAILANQK